MICCIFIDSLASTMSRSDPKRLASTLGTENEESCTTYNMLKVCSFAGTLEAKDFLLYILFKLHLGNVLLSVFAFCFKIITIIDNSLLLWV